MTLKYIYILVVCVIGSFLRNTMSNMGRYLFVAGIRDLEANNFHGFVILTRCQPYIDCMIAQLYLLTSEREAFGRLKRQALNQILSQGVLLVYDRMCVAFLYSSSPGWGSVV